MTLEDVSTEDMTDELDLRGYIVIDGEEYDDLVTMIKQLKHK